jgi:MFS family permease
MLAGVIIDIQALALSPLIGTMAAESNLSGADIGWIINATMLGGAVSIGLTSRIGDKYGHRKVLIGLTALAMVGCLLSATGTSFWPLVIGRFLSGFGILIPLAWGMLRPRATAGVVRHVSLAYSVSLAICTPLTIVAGGLIVDAGLPWQGVFWVTFGLFALVLVFALLSPETPKEVRESVRVDWLGGVGVGIWATALLIGLSEGPGRGWTSPLVLGAFAVCAVVLVVWTVHERRTSEPLMSFKNMDVRQTIVGLSGVVLLSIFPGMALFLGLPALLQTPASSGFGLGLSPLESSYVLLAMLPGSALGYLWTRWGLNRLGPKKVLVISGIGGALVYLGFAFAHQTVWMACLFVFGYALTLLSCLTTGYTLVASSGRQDNMAVTVGMQTVIGYTAATLPVPIVLSVLVPGADGYIPESAFVGIYVASALVIAVFVIVWAVFAPKHITDRHAIDTETDPTKIAIAVH